MSLARRRATHRPALRVRRWQPPVHEYELGIGVLGAVCKVALRRLLDRLASAPIDPDKRSRLPPEHLWHLLNAL
jgi:hypothetical protein